MWLVFAYTDEPQGGLSDIVGAFTTEEQCQNDIRIRHKESNMPKYFEAHYCHSNDIRVMQVYNSETKSFKLEVIDLELK